jgi:subtilisin family serine protease
MGRRFLDLQLLLALLAFTAWSAGGQSLEDSRRSEAPLPGRVAGLEVSADAYHLTADRHTTVMIELFDQTAVERWVQVRAAAGGERAAVNSAHAVTAVREQLARIERAQRDLLGALERSVPSARALYRCRRVYNGVAVDVECDRVGELLGLPSVKAVHPLLPATPDLTTAVPFLRMPKLWRGAAGNLTGKGIKVGVIDTGINHLHADFGGPGTAPPAGPHTNSNWPRTTKVVGGWDFCGDNYDAGNTDPARGHETRYSTCLGSQNGTRSDAKGLRKAGCLMGSKLFVGNLDFKTTREEIQALFSEVGPLRDVFLPTDRGTSRPRGFAFVEFESEDDATRAVARFNGFELGGRALRVNVAEERSPRDRIFGGADRPPAGGGFTKPKGSRRNIRGRKRSL